MKGRRGKKGIGQEIIEIMIGRETARGAGRGGDRDNMAIDLSVSSEPLEIEKLGSLWKTKPKNIDNP